VDDLRTFDIILSTDRIALFLWFPALEPNEQIVIQAFLRKFLFDNNATGRVVGSFD